MEDESDGEVDDDEVDETDPSTTERDSSLLFGSAFSALMSSVGPVGSIGSVLYAPSPNRCGEFSNFVGLPFFDSVPFLSLPRTFAEDERCDKADEVDLVVDEVELSDDDEEDPACSSSGSALVPSPFVPQVPCTTTRVPASP